MYLNLNLALLLLVLINDSATIGRRLAPDEITFLILSQENEYHRGIAQHLKQHIAAQAMQLQEVQKSRSRPAIFLSHETFGTKRGAWAVLPIVEEIRHLLIRNHTKWLVLLETSSRVNLEHLLHSLRKEDSDQEQYLGYPIYDLEPTIIHHFSFLADPSQFKYPLTKAGVALTVPLLDRMVKRMPNSTLSSDFFIDAAHELALFIWNKNNGVRLKAAPYLCARKRKNCAIYGTEFPTCTKEKPPVDMRRILFAVKTCKKFHKDRLLDVVMNTWGELVPNLRIFSDVADPTIPTVATSVPNTETGHCEKTIKILNLIEAELSASSNQSATNTSHPRLPPIEWIVLADDDTIMGINRLARHLACYQPSHDLYLGERYGYQLLDEIQGYNYVTGGGGLVLSRPTLQKLATHCKCPAPTSPDDMILAACLSQFRISATHSPLFHQARPLDYAAATIDPNTISFHKFWQIDPLAVYRQWFKQDDDNFYRIKRNHANDDEGDASPAKSARHQRGAGAKHASCNEIIRQSDYEMNHTDL